MSEPAAAVSAFDATASGAIDELCVTQADLWWLEVLPHDHGRVALVQVAADGARREPLGPNADVGSDLHGYGGGAYAVDGPLIWYVDRSDGDLRLFDRHGARTVLRCTPDEHLGDLSAHEGVLWCVRESSNGDQLLEIRPDGTHRVLVDDNGFLGSPRPSASRLAWLRWDADRMPWDGSELYAATRSGAEPTDIQRVAGGRDESVTQPRWDDTGALWFLSDRDGWWSVYRWRDGSTPATALSAQVDLAVPQWEAGYQSYAVLPGGGVVVVAYDGPWHRVLLQDRDGLRRIPSDSTSFKPYLAVRDQQLFAIAAAPDQAPHVTTIDLSRSGVTGTASPSPTRSWSAHHPEFLRLPTPDGQTITALIHSPTQAARRSLAPLIVRAHPGPTSAISSRLDGYIRYMTSQGFTVADVDYRGSSGYGRAFRRSLYGQWGTADVQDCIAVAEKLLADGRAVPGAIFITGASAGGFTALQAVSQPSIFAGAVARSAIIDPLRWQRTAPRWQRPHAAALTGPAGAVQADRIQRPVLFIHGSDDHIAPLDDVVALTDGLTGHGMPHQLFVLDARHELGAQESTSRALEAEHRFYEALLTKS